MPGDHRRIGLGVRFQSQSKRLVSRSFIFHQGSVSDPIIWKNLLILAGISLVLVVAGTQLFKRTAYR